MQSNIFFIAAIHVYVVNLWMYTLVDIIKQGLTWSRLGYFAVIYGSILTLELVTCNVYLNKCT